MLKASQRVSRRGTVTVWVVVCLSVIIGVVAIGMDGGRMMDERRGVQSATDAAALAAGGDMYENYLVNKGADPSATARAAVLRVAAANGYANDGTNSVVTVNIPPQSGPYAGKTDYVEVLIESNIDAGFSRIFSAGKLTVRGRAVSRGRPHKIGLLVLRPIGPSALLTSASGSLRVVNAPIIVNSVDPLAYTNQSGDVVSADSFEIAGGYANLGKPLVGPVHTGVSPTPDPLRTFPPPDTTAYPLRSASTLILNSQTTILQPGVYRGGIVIKGSAKVTFQPGVYVLDGGGLIVTSNSQLIGNEVMLYNTGGLLAGPIDFTGNSNVILTPPTSGTYAGISIFQDRTLPSVLTVTGNTSLQVGGTIYAPAAAVVVTGSARVTPYAPGGGIIAWQLTVSGNADFVVDPGSNRPRARTCGWWTECCRARPRRWDRPPPNKQNCLEIACGQQDLPGPPEAERPADRRADRGCRPTVRRKLDGTCLVVARVRRAADAVPGEAADGRADEGAGPRPVPHPGRTRQRRLRPGVPRPAYCHGEDGRGQGDRAGVGRGLAPAPGSSGRCWRSPNSATRTSSWPTTRTRPKGCSSW